MLVSVWLEADLVCSLLVLCVTCLVLGMLGGEREENFCRAERKDEALVSFSSAVSGEWTGFDFL